MIQHEYWISFRQQCIKYQFPVSLIVLFQLNALGESINTQTQVYLLLCTNTTPCISKEASKMHANKKRLLWYDINNYWCIHNPRYECLVHVYASISLNFGLKKWFLFSVYGLKHDICVHYVSSFDLLSLLSDMGNRLQTSVYTVMNRNNTWFEHSTFP